MTAIRAAHGFQPSIRLLASQPNRPIAGFFHAGGLAGAGLAALGGGPAESFQGQAPCAGSCVAAAAPARPNALGRFLRCLWVPSRIGRLGWCWPCGLGGRLDRRFCPNVRALAHLPLRCASGWTQPPTASTSKRAGMPFRFVSIRFGLFGFQTGCAVYGDADGQGLTRQGARGARTGPWHSIGLGCQAQSPAGFPCLSQMLGVK